MTTQSRTGEVAKTAAKTATKHLIKRKFRLATLKYQLAIAGILLAIVLIVVLISGIAAIIGNSNDSATSEFELGPGQAQVSPEVAQYREAVQAELSQHGLTQYTELLLALMMQESGGRGNDPMQASESFCGSIGCITDPQVSIEKGVLHFKRVLEKANNDVKLTLQSYNFGGGFIDYVMNNGGSYTKELAISFSQMMYEKLAHTGIYKCHRPEAIEHSACYGDIGYVDAVLRYLPSAIVGGSESLGDFASPLSRSLVVNSEFGYRIHPIHKVPKLHAGIDFACTAADTIHAIKDGTVVDAKFHSGLGNYVKIQHGGYYTTYGHMSSLNVSAGQTVTKGQGIGYCGSTGGSTGPHLHLEISTQLWSGHINPRQYLGL